MGNLTEKPFDYRSKSRSSFNGKNFFNEIN